MKIRPVWSDDPRYRLPWSIGSVNAFYAGFCAAIPAIAGSLLTFLYYVSAVWVVINALYRRYTLRLPRRALPFAIACGSYFLIILATGLMADNRDRLFYSMFPMLTLPFVPLVIARFRIAAPDRSWRMFVRYAPLGAVAGVASVLLTGNQEGGAGNPNIFAVIMAVLAIYSLAGIEGGTLPRKLTALAGYICGVAGVILADARTLAILMPVLPFVFFDCRRSIFESMDIGVRPCADLGRRSLLERTCKRVGPDGGRSAGPARTSFINVGWDQAESLVCVARGNTVQSIHRARHTEQDVRCRRADG